MQADHFQPATWLAVCMAMLLLQWGNFSLVLWFSYGNMYTFLLGMHEQASIDAGNVSYVLSRFALNKQ
jgi:hypothetical protein